jgi:hypothetical protein
VNTASSRETQTVTDTLANRGQYGRPQSRPTAS